MSATKTWAWLAPGIALVATACTALPNAGALPEPASLNSAREAVSRHLIAPGREIVLPKPAALAKPVEAVQQIRATAGGESVVFEAHVSVTAERLLLVAVDGAGRRAMTITWNGQDMKVENAPWLPPNVQAGNLLSDLMVLHFPSASVREAVAAAGCELDIGKHTRRVRCGESDVIRADYEGPQSAPFTGTVRYRNEAWGYDVEIRSAARSR